MRPRHALSVLLAVAVASVVAAAPPDVPKELKAEPGQLIRIVVKGDKVGSLRNFGDDQAFFDELAPRPGERRYVFQATRPGTYVLGFWTLGDDYGATTTITVGGTPPVPPGPGPNPPGPAPAANPFGATPGLRVMIVYNAKDNSLPLAQQAVLRGAKMADYLLTKVGDGKYMIVPDTEVFSTEPEVAPFKAALARTDRTKLPWLYVGKESAGLSAALPADADGTIALIDPFTK